MDKLYSPWRQKYVTGESKKITHKNCPFCANIATNQDNQNFILKRYKYACVQVNVLRYRGTNLKVHKHIYSV